MNLYAVRVATRISHILYVDAKTPEAAQEQVKPYNLPELMFRDHEMPHQDEPWEVVSVFELDM